MEWFIIGGLLWAASMIGIIYLRHRLDSAKSVDYLEKHYEELDAD